MFASDVKAVVLKNLRETETAFRVGVALDEEVWRALGRLTDEWAKSKGWTGYWDDPWERDLTVAPEDWVLSRSQKKKGDNNVYLSAFRFEAGFGDNWDRDDPNEDAFWIQRLCGVGRGEVGFRWSADYQKMGYSKTQWREVLRGQAETLVRNTKFAYEDKDGVSFFHRVRVPLDALSQALSKGMPESALDAYSDGLDAVAKAAPIFGAIMKKPGKKKR